MTIVNGQVANATEVLSGYGSPLAQLAYEQVVSDATNWSNTDYLGADEFTDSNGAKNTIDTGTSTACFNADKYELKDISILADVNYYVIIEASNGPINADGIYQFSSGKWIIYDTNSDTNSESVQKAVIYRRLFYNNEISGYDTVTSIKVSSSSDVGARGYKATLTTSDSGSSTNTGTFSATTDNTNVNSWSYVSATMVETGANTNRLISRWEIPSGTVKNIIDFESNDPETNTSNELGTDTSGDDINNPVNCRLYVSNTDGEGHNTANVIVLTKKSITWDGTNVDYKTTYSLPDTTQSDTLENEGVYNPGDTYPPSETVETNTIINEVVPDSIVVYGKTTLQTGTSITVDVSDDGGSTFGLTAQALNTAIDTSSFSTGDIALKFNLATTDTTVTPKLYGYGVAITDK